MLSSHTTRCEALGFLQNWETGCCFPWDLAGNGGANPQRAVELGKSLPALSTPGWQEFATLPARCLGLDLAPRVQNAMKCLRS